MKQLLFAVYFLLAASASTVFAEQAKATGVKDVYFSPRGGATEAVVAENMKIIKGNRELVDKYLDNFRDHLFHSEPYGR